MAWLDALNENLRVSHCDVLFVPVIVAVLEGSFGEKMVSNGYFLVQMSISPKMGLLLLKMVLQMIWGILKWFKICCFECHVNKLGNVSLLHLVEKVTLLGRGFFCLRLSMQLITPWEGLSCHCLPDYK